MKLSEIARLVKADKYCKLYQVLRANNTYELYIGTKAAIFPLEGFPKPQNEKELAAMLGITDDAWMDIAFDVVYTEGALDIGGLNLMDTADGEIDCITSRISIGCGKDCFIPVVEPKSQTVAFVDSRQIMPVKDEKLKSNFFKYCARRTASGSRYFVLKDGMIVRGAVLPAKIDSFAKQMIYNLADMLKKTNDAADVECLDDQEGD